MLFHDYLNIYARDRSAETCVAVKSSSYSYGDMERLSNQLANGLLSLGINKGDRVAILGANSVFHCILMCAASKTGAIALPLNHRLSPVELSFIINDAGVAALIVLDTHHSVLGSLRSTVSESLLIITESSADENSLSSWLSSQHDRMVPIETCASDPLLLLYTSGTTGKPKGVLSAHKNLLALCSMNETAISHRSNVGTSVIVCSPLFHIGGAAAVVQGVYSGQQMLIHEAFEASRLLDDLENHHVESLFVVPSMLMTLLQDPNIEKRDFRNLRRICYGASPISEALLRRAMEVFKCQFYQMYGMTETTGSVVSLSAADHERALSGRPELLLSCGRPNVGAGVKITDSDGVEVPENSIGEIWLKSDTNMIGYYNLPEASKAALVDGWVRTGDAGYLDEDGYLYLKDRIKDMVVSGGENIYPAEVEKVLSSHADIADVAVIGVPDEKYGEALMAVIVPVEGASPQISHLIDFCRDYLAGYKIPRQMQLTEALPRNPAGKILKNELRAPYWSNSSRSIA